MVGLHLARRWARDPRVRLTVWGAGASSPAPECDYLRLPEAPESSPAPDLTGLSERGYARFCRAFEAAATARLARLKEAFDPARTVVVVNDISESPDLDAVARLGYPIVSIWHVDVVDFFNRLYLREGLAPERLTKAYAALRAAGLGRLVPDMLRLVFDKQRQAVERARLLILPSRRMADTVERCYPRAEVRRRAMPLPWGAFQEEFPEEALAREASRLRAHYQLREDSRVVMTLSRISPEKGIHHLLEALRLLEASRGSRGWDVCLFVCGEPAFMRGSAYGRAVRAAAERLSRFRVFFPGYLPAFEKQAYLRLARLFVSPSVHESYGLTLVEALRAGLPVLASDHHGVEETLRPAYGRAVPYGKPRRRAGLLAEALEEMLADLDALGAMGEAARRAARGMSFPDAADKLLSAALGLL